MRHEHRQQPGQNRRREQRLRASGVLVQHVALSGTLLDFSRGGIAIESSRGLRIGDRYRLELASTAVSCTLEAIVRWCRLHTVRPDSTGKEFQPLFIAGLEID